MGLKIWVKHREEAQWVSQMSQMVSVIRYKFYTEEVALKAVVINTRSTMSVIMKRVVLSLEVLLMLLNCIPELPWTNVRERLEEMVLRNTLTERMEER